MAQKLQKKKTQNTEEQKYCTIEAKFLLLTNEHKQYFRI